MCSNPRIACWMSEKKLHKFNWPEFQNICNENGYEAFKVCKCVSFCEYHVVTICFQLDLEKDLDSQGPFDLLFHKLTEVITFASQGDQKVSNYVNYLHA